MQRLLRHSKLVLLTLVLALGGLATASVTPAAHAGSGPSITAYYSAGSGVSVLGTGFTIPNYQDPKPTVRIEVLNPSLTQVLGTLYVPVNAYGGIDAVVTGNDIPCFESYSGSVYVAADGQPGPTAWAQTYASFPSTWCVALHFHL